jgi:probable phosphomutase (TIGR03848 family)
VTTVLLVRHGRTSANARGVLAGWTPGVHLDEEGREQAKRTAQRLADVPLDGFVTSPLERCRETAEILSANHGSAARLNSDLDLAECRYGEWTGRSLAELRQEPLWHAVEHTPGSVTFPNGESMAGMQGRALQAVRRWNARFGAQGTYVAVTHGDVIKAILADALGMHLDMFQRIVVDPCSVSVIRYAPQRSHVLRMNDTGSSLSDPLAGPEDGAARLGGGGR